MEQNQQSSSKASAGLVAQIEWYLGASFQKIQSTSQSEQEFSFGFEPEEALSSRSARLEVVYKTQASIQMRK